MRHSRYHCGRKGCGGPMADARPPAGGPRPFAASQSAEAKRPPFSTKLARTRTSLSACPASSKTRSGASPVPSPHRAHSRAPLQVPLPCPSSVATVQRSSPAPRNSTCAPEPTGCGGSPPSASADRTLFQSKVRTTILKRCIAMSVSSCACSPAAYRRILSVFSIRFAAYEPCRAKQALEGRCARSPRGDRQERRRQKNQTFEKTGGFQKATQGYERW